MNRNLLIYLLGLVFLVLACKGPVDETPYDLSIPAGFPNPEIPADNALTQARVALGKRLFYDKILSRDQSISCNSCHIQELAFSDGKVKSLGVEDRIGRRNAPALYNLAYLKAVNRDGGVPKLDLQAIVPIEDHAEMDLSIDSAANRLNADPSYKIAFANAYGEVATPFTITRALGSFIRILISGNSPWDRYRNGDMSALSPEAIKGRNLFFSPRVRCMTCHSGFNLTDNSFSNIGLYEEYPDKGRSRVTINPEDAGKYRVPSLRNVALTAPYMHDGSMETLEEVMAHYVQGGANHPNKDINIFPLDINEEEQKAILAFLESLTDESFLQNPAFLP